jgi:hypothetical protein
MAGKINFNFNPTHLIITLQQIINIRDLLVILLSIKFKGLNCYLKNLKDLILQTLNLKISEYIYI